MNYDNFKCAKTTCEKYTIKFNDGWDYAIFTIDNTGMFNCQSTFGNYNYHWGSFGDNFKKFLIHLDDGYLYCKLCDRNYFDFDAYIEKCKRAIIKLRRQDELSKEQARDLWQFFTEEIDDNGSYDVTCMEIYNNRILDELYSGEVFYSEFSPEQDYSPRMKGFIKNVFPMFVEVLKGELSEAKSA